MEIIAAFRDLIDPDNPGRQMVLAILKKEELGDVQGSDSLHPARSGDVVVVLRPPYQFNASTPGKRIALTPFFGNHGYLPDLVDLPHQVNMHGVFVAAGPGIRKQEPIRGVRAVDLAPTISRLMGIPGPSHARGRILFGLFPSLPIRSPLKNEPAAVFGILLRRHVRNSLHSRGLYRCTGISHVGAALGKGEFGSNQKKRVTGS